MQNNDTFLTLALPQSTKDNLRGIAVEHGLTLSMLVRVILNDFLRDTAKR